METKADFNLPMTDALSFFRDKGLKGSFKWQDMMRQEHAHAFTVAKMMDIDLLTTVQSELNKMLSNGGTLADFQQSLIPNTSTKGLVGKARFNRPGNRKSYSGPTWQS